MCDEYNGWENKPTWLLYTWITSDYNKNKYWSSVAKDHTDFELSAIIEQSVKKESWDEIAEASFYRDALTYILSVVDYDKVAKALKS